MASSKYPISKPRYVLILIAALCSSPWPKLVRCSEFEVGERLGWVVPPSNDTQMHNEWASKLRFKVGDTIRFKYKKDSVLVVNQKDYKECNSTRPDFFSNTGNTIYTLDRSGFFYFISGATGHCGKGQRMIVWVMAQDGSHKKSIASDDHAFASYRLVAIVFAFQFAYLKLA